MTILGKVRFAGLRTLVRRTATARPLVPDRAVARHLGAGVLAATLVAGGTQVALDRMSRLPADAAFRIGHVTTTKEQLDHRVQLLSALYGVQRPSDPKKIDQFDRDTAKAVAVSDILAKAAADRGIVIADKTASDQLDQLVSQSFPQGRQDFTAKLGQLGVSERDVLTEIKRQLANAKLYAAVTKSVAPLTEAQLRQAFEQRKSRLVTAEQRHLRNIVVATQDAANGVLRRARSGTDFAKLAESASLDESTKAKGGDLGTVTAAQLEKPYADAAFKARDGSVFGPVQTQDGWNVGQVVKVVPGRPLAYDQVKTQLADELDAERRSPVWSAWLGGRLKAAHVEYAREFRPADPLSPPKTQP